MTKFDLSRRALLGGVLAAPLARQAFGKPLKRRRRPNILFITMDELRPDAMRCSGNDAISTPNIDRLAARGAMFTRTYCQGPLCQPARASIITGQYVKEHGQTWNRFDMKPEWPTVMKALQAAGYTTAIIGKTHFGGSLARFRGTESTYIDLRTMTPWGMKFGLDYLLEEYDHYVHKNPKIVTPYTEYLRHKGLLETYRDQTPGFRPDTNQALWRPYESKLSEEDTLSSFVGDNAIDWLGHYRQDKPFFLWASFIEPHPPIASSSRWFEAYKSADISTGTRRLPDMPNNAWGRYLHEWTTLTKSADMTDENALHMARGYYALVSQVDKKIGDLLNALESSSHARDTWIIFGADHGEMLAHHNLVFKNVFYRGSVLVPNVIVAPDATAKRTIESPVQSIDVTATIVDLADANLPTCRGKSLLPLVNGEGEARKVVYSELAGLNNKGNYFVMVATDHYRYMYDKQNKLACELFDLERDPDEMHNLVSDPAYAGIRDDLHKDYLEPFLAT